MRVRTVGTVMRTRRSLTMAVGIVFATALASMVNGPANAADRVLHSGGEVVGDVGAQLGAIVPFAGGTSFPIVIGEADARLDGSAATAVSGVIDFGVLGALATLAVASSPTLKEAGVPSSFARDHQLPGPVVADSRTNRHSEAAPVVPDAGAGPLGLHGGHEMADAPTGGPATAVTELAGWSVRAGPVTVAAAGATSRTIAARDRAEAVTTIASVRIDGGPTPVELRGLEWHLAQRLGQPAEASFSMTGASLGTVKLSVASPAAVAAALATIDRFLTMTGVSISAPAATPGGLGALRVELKDSKTLASSAGAVYAAALGAVVNEVENTSVGVLPESGVGFTAANVGLSALTGRGGFALDLGGSDLSLGRRPIEEYVYRLPDQTVGPAGTLTLADTVVGGLAIAAPAAAPPAAATPVAFVGDRPTVAWRTRPVGARAPLALLLLLACAAWLATRIVDRRRREPATTRRS